MEGEFYTTNDWRNPKDTWTASRTSLTQLQSMWPQAAPVELSGGTGTSIETEVQTALSAV